MAEKFEKRLQDLGDRVTDMERTQKDFRHSLRTDYSKFKEWVRREVDLFHDYITRQEGYQSGLKDAEIKKQINTGDIRISKEAWWLIAKVLGFTGTALAIILAIVNAKR